MPMKTRMHLRVPLPLPVRIKLYEQSEEFISTKIGDVSWGGVFVLMDPPPQPETRLVLQFTMTEDNVSLDLGGKVVRSRPGGDSEPAGIGVQFDPLDDETRSLLQKLINDEVLALVKA